MLSFSCSPQIDIIFTPLLEFKWDTVFTTVCGAPNMIDFSILCRFSRVAHASSSSDPPSNPCPSASEPSSSSQKQSRVRKHEIVDTVVDAHELTAQVKNVKPLLQTPVKHAHTPLIQGSIPKETAIATHAALSGLSPEKEKRLRELYERLDIDNDGTVDIRDLTAALKHEMPHIPSRLAPKLMARISHGDDGNINFGDFVKYVVEHEKRLEVIFQDLDKNNDGLIDVREIKLFCNELGIPLDDRKARDILHK
ncbi:hypothetical protein Y032_1120g3632 [Ancylostoma ceylanicum]|uniref:EF-hand domain-containing protein n=1 Tax=Ancylostoma ceylanicum TaxID=53326 RepID=A0A016W869_9BILA|nr:hypothetical protein Y032_1120g3632 [Ancylostoma ceylanicum]